MERTFTAVYERYGDWFLGCVEELPGASTQGWALEESRENLREAIERILQANRELAVSPRAAAQRHP